MVTQMDRPGDKVGQKWLHKWTDLVKQKQGRHSNVVAQLDRRGDTIGQRLLGRHGDTIGQTF